MPNSIEPQSSPNALLRRGHHVDHRASGANHGGRRLFHTVANGWTDHYGLGDHCVRGLNVPANRSKMPLCTWVYGTAGLR